MIAVIGLVLCCRALAQMLTVSHGFLESFDLVHLLYDQCPLHHAAFYLQCLAG